MWLCRLHNPNNLRQLHHSRIFNTLSRASAASIYRDSHVKALHDLAANDLPSVTLRDRQVTIGWGSRVLSKFHTIWLRDHCRCPECFHSITKQRLLNTFDIPRDIEPARVESNSEGLVITWPYTRPHVSFYPWSWLKLNSYDPPFTETRKSSEKTLWGSKIAEAPPTLTYEEAMEQNDRGLYKWLNNIDLFGFSFVTGVPANPKDTEQLIERIGFIRETQYGRFWDFTSDLAKGDTAYTNLALGAHTDNTYYTDPCGLQAFHLLSHTHGSGGATLLVDGLYVASIVKKLDPEAYDLLTNVPVPAHAAGEASSFYKPSPPLGYPVLQVDKMTGQVDRVRWNNDDRSVMNHLEPHLVQPWYDAIRVWHEVLTSSDSEYWVQLQPGTVVVVNNHRVLHGRSGFNGRRRMCGAYIGIDEYYSKLTVLRERFNNAIGRNGNVVNGRSIWNSDL